MSLMSGNHNGQKVAVSVTPGGALLTESASAAGAWNWNSWIGTSAGENVKNSSGKVLALRVSHSGSDVAWFQLFDANDAPEANDVPVESIPLFTPGYLVLGQGDFGSGGMDFGNGIAWGLSSESLIYTPGTAADVIVRIAWL